MNLLQPRQVNPFHTWVAGLLGLALTLRGGTPTREPWTEGAIQRISSFEVTSPLDDLNGVGRLFQGARIIGLGVATHGTSEFELLNLRMVRYLVERQGLRALALEADFSECNDLNDYILGKAEDPRALLLSMDRWVWNTQETLALLQWLRAYNDDPHHLEKIHLFGIDLQNPGAALFQLWSYLEGRRPGITRPWREVLAPLSGKNRNPHYSSLHGRSRARIKMALSQMRAQLIKAGAPVEDAGDPSRRARLLQTQRVLEREEAMFANPAKATALREDGLTENARWVLNQQSDSKPLAIWAHLGHLAKTPHSGKTWMGVRLAREFGAKYRAIAQTFRAGAFRAIDLDGHPPTDVRVFTLNASTCGTIESALSMPGIPCAFWDLCDPQDPGRPPWLKNLHTLRSIGAGFSPAQQGTFYLQVSPILAFDGLILVDKTTPTHPLHPDYVRSPARPSTRLAENLDFEIGEPGTPPPGWRCWSPDETIYRITVSADHPFSGRKCLNIKSLPGAAAASFGNVIQSIDPTAFRGKRFRLGAWVRTSVEGLSSYACLWVRVNRKVTGDGFFDNMEDRPIRSSEWRHYSIEGFVDADALSLDFGAFLSGQGEMWLDEVTLNPL